MNKGVPGIFQDELGGKIIIEVAALRAKTYAYLVDGYNDGDNDDDDDDDDDDYEKKKIIDEKVKGTKKCVIKRKLIFKNYKDYLFNDKTILRSQQGFKSYHHKVYIRSH